MDVEVVRETDQGTALPRVPVTGSAPWEAAPPPPGAAPAPWQPAQLSRWQPAQPAAREHVQPQAPPLPARTTVGGKAQGAAGGAMAGLFAVLKYGAVALKFGKFGPMVISMAVSVGALTLLYGWRFGAGLVGLIFVHEMGHVLFARAEGVKTTLPFFLGPFGALIMMKAPPRDARQEAVIGIGGPVVGTLGALACALLAANATGSTRLLLIALAYAGFFINLFNLVPIVPLDGGRVTRAVPLWLLFSGLGVIGWAVWASSRWGQGVNPIVLIVLLIAAIAAVQRLFKRREETPYIAAVPGHIRVALGIAWIALIGVTGLGMSIAHNHLVNGGAISAPSSDATTGALGR